MNGIYIQLKNLTFTTSFYEAKRITRSDLFFN
jgi:hypothetical protein